MIPMHKTKTDCGSESCTIVQTGEIPKFIRIFYGMDHNGKQLYSNCGFDYEASTKLLQRDPDQVQYVTYEYKRRTKECPSNHIRECECCCSCSRCVHQSPLRWACLETVDEADAMKFLSVIRDLDPTQFLLQDSNGQLPIDGECVLNASLELLAFLLEIYLDYDFVCPNGVGMTEGNFNPIICLCDSYWWEDIHQANEEIRSGSRVVSGKNVLEDTLGIETIFWEKIILLTKAFYHKTIVEDYTEDDVAVTKDSPKSFLRITNDYADRRVQFRLLQACAGIDWFPPNLLKLLVAAFPEALLEKDEDGNLPIHIAAGGFFDSYRTMDANSSDRELEANSGYQKTTIDILLEANPEQAKIPDADGRLPLELAIESGIRDENDMSSSFYRHDKRLRPWEDGGIRSLLEAYPEAAKMRSPVTGKLPLEVTLGRGSYRDWEDGVQALLAAYPEAAKIRNPWSGKYPLQLAIERETHFDEGVYALLKGAPEATWGCSAVDISDEGTQNSSRKRKRNCGTNNGNGDGTRPRRQRRACVPLFAHAALEKCSPSVVYKLLRTNPESCRWCFETTTTATTTHYNGHRLN